VAKSFAATPRAENTNRAYSADWADFTAWCDENGRLPLPACPRDLADYITALALPPRSLKPSTITRRCSSIATAHRLVGLQSPLRGKARDTLSGVRRLAPLLNGSQ
jgi:hypothetical protein